MLVLLVRGGGGGGTTAEWLRRGRLRERFSFKARKTVEPPVRQSRRARPTNVCVCRLILRNICAQNKLDALAFFERELTFVLVKCSFAHPHEKMGAQDLESRFLSLIFHLA